MGLVLDIVPNHMATDPANPFWADPALREQFFDLDPVTGRHRRFFDIDDLAGVRQEDPAVFEATHELVLSLVADGVVDGLRIDHPDGLADPAGYLQRLRDGGVERVWVEKILDPGRAPARLAGQRHGRLRVPQRRLRAVRRSRRRGFDDSAVGDGVRRQPGIRRGRARGKARAGARDVRARASIGCTGSAPRSIWTISRSALAGLPVYRTYVEPAAGAVSELDRADVAELPEPVRRRLLLEEPAPAEFVTRFQQTTPAIMAKGVEDTAFYRYARLLALNDVGGDPSRFSIDVDRFHAGCVERRERFPLNLLTTMTHDAKRSADVRARIGALASVADEWRACVERWLELTEPLRSNGAPDDVERHFLFQTLVGAWPISSERIGEYMFKALARSEAQHELGGAGPRVGGRRRAVLPGVVRRSRVHLLAGGVRGSARAAR